MKKKIITKIPQRRKNSKFKSENRRKRQNQHLPDLVPKVAGLN